MNSYFLPLFTKLHDFSYPRRGPQKCFFYSYPRNHVSATGLLISYYNRKKQQKILLVKEKRNDRTSFADLGGRIHTEDKCIFDALAREAWTKSETRLFGRDTELDEFKQLLKTCLMNATTKLIYVPSAKYLLVSVRCDSRLPEECAAVAQASLQKSDTERIEREFFWGRPQEIKTLLKRKSINPRIEAALMKMLYIGTPPRAIT